MVIGIVLRHATVLIERGSY